MNTHFTKIALAASLAVSLSTNATAQNDQAASLHLTSQSRTAGLELQIDSPKHSYAMLFADAGVAKPTKTSIGTYYLCPKNQIFVGLIPLQNGKANLKVTIPNTMTVGLQSILFDARLQNFKCSSYSRISFAKQRNGKTMGAVFSNEQNGNGSAKIHVEARQQAKVEVFSGNKPVGLRRPYWTGLWLEAFLQEFNLVDCYTVYVDGIPMGTIPNPCP